MYKIYIKEKPLILTDTSADLSDYLGEPKTIVTPYLGNPKSFLPYIDMLSKNGRSNKVVIHTKKKKKLKEEFFKLVQVVKAGGGLVLNQEGKMLVIFRRGNWDLPKGKIERNETKRAAAMREVMEETGINQVRIESKLIKTYHLFRNKSNKRALKLSYWYVMSTEDTELIPQLEEDIEKAEWVDPAIFLKSHAPIYCNIVDVVENYLRSV